MMCLWWPLCYSNEGQAGAVGSTNFFETSPCRELGVVEPLAYPSMETDKRRFDSTIFSQALFPLFSIS